MGYRASGLGPTFRRRCRFAATAFLQPIEPMFVVGAHSLQLLLKLLVVLLELLNSPGKLCERLLKLVDPVFGIGPGTPALRDGGGWQQENC